MAAGVEEAAELDWDGEGAAVKGLEEAHDHADGDRQRGVAGGATAAVAGSRRPRGRGAGRSLAAGHAMEGEVAAAEEGIWEETNEGIGVGSRVHRRDGEIFCLANHAVPRGQSVEES
jgi:hypothetical protein